MHVRVMGWLGLSLGEGPVRWGIASLCRQPPWAIAFVKTWLTEP